MQKEKTHNCNSSIPDLMSLIPAGQPTSLVSGWTKVTTSLQFLGHGGGIQELPRIKKIYIIK